MTTGEVIEETVTIYDDNGKTCFPKSIREKVGVGEGDKLTWIEKDGHLMVVAEQSVEQEN